MLVIKHVIFIVVLITLTTGCIKKNTKPIQRVPFLISEYEELSQTGTGKVTGQAFLRTRGGDVKVAAGSGVMLNPITSYSHQWYERQYMLGIKLTEVDNRIWRYTFKTIADAEGKFNFTDIPPGYYYLVSMVFWETSTGYNGALQKQGGIIAKIIEVKNDMTTNEILTR